MERLDLHLRNGFILILVVLGVMSCGLTPLLIWFVSIKDYPKSFDAEGVTLRNGRRLPWKDLTETRRLILRSRGGGRQVVTGVGLVFGKTHVKVAPRVLVEGPRVFPYLSRILGQDLTKP